LEAEAIGGKIIRARLRDGCDGGRSEALGRGFAVLRPRRVVMLKLISDLPADVLGVEATGKVTHEDYRKVLIPTAEAMMSKGPIRMLYVMGQDFSGYELGALWDDGAFGIKHWRDFSRVAVVGDAGWLRTAVTLFKPFFPCAVRLFRLAELSAARAWITDAQTRV
jgi:hypothetical protein